MDETFKISVTIGRDSVTAQGFGRKFNRPEKQLKLRNMLI
jgi:hypothetical protein